MTAKTKKPEFFKAKLVKVPNILAHVYPNYPEITLEERLPNNGKCPECKDNRWWLLPKESAAVRSGGKPYIECLTCGYLTHL